MNFTFFSKVARLTICCHIFSVSLGIQFLKMRFLFNLSPLTYKKIFKLQWDGIGSHLEWPEFIRTPFIVKITRFLPQKRNSDLANSTARYFRQCPNAAVFEEAQRPSQDSSKHSVSSSGPWTTAWKPEPGQWRGLSDSLDRLQLRGEIYH